MDPKATDTAHVAADDKNGVVDNVEVETPAAPEKIQPEKDQIIALVIDSAPLLKGTPLRHLAERFCTIPEVVSEIRDKQSREYIKKLPFELELITPSEESIKAGKSMQMYGISPQASITGDFATLSTVDLKVLALTHMLEVQANGDKRLRTEPVKTKVHSKQPREAPQVESNTEPEQSNAQEDDGWEVAGRGKNKSYRIPQPVQQPEVQETLQELSIDEAKEGDEEKNGAEDAAQEMPEDEDDDSDGGEWITPENVIEKKAAELGHKAEGKTKKAQVMQAACITADFAMQNVLLQMNLNLVSTDGMRVKRIKNWVMRCHACYHVTSDMDKKFCPKCGNSSLMRTSCSTDQYGNVTYWMKKNFQYNLRGTKYNIPRPEGGTKANNIVLREDQKEYLKAMKSRRKQKQVNAFDPDYMPSFNMAPGKQINGNMYGTDVVGFGRKNPNATSRRKR